MKAKQSRTHDRRLARRPKPGTGTGTTAGTGTSSNHVGNLAAVDCGTLSTRLLVSGPTGEPAVRLTRITGLGEGVDRSRTLLPQAIERALAVLREYRELMDLYDVYAVRMVGTSALRDATNRASFSAAAEEVIGTPLTLLSGEEEASLSFLGATADLSRPDTEDGAVGPWLAADIGGGSTELVVGKDVPTARSLDLGCVRVTERFLHHDPPTSEELGTAGAWLGEQYRKAETDLPALRSAVALLGLAGTVAALACFDQGLENYYHQAVHHHKLSRKAVDWALQELAALPASRRSGLPGIEPARAPMIVGGALVLATLMAHFCFEECLVSVSDLLDGLVITLIRGGEGPSAPQ
jgi:exopolyphosphatase / guanosine-5'-triphosphate,3'-diphosphate pyrophosphatase